MASHRIVKIFHDYADDIEAVNIHYLVAPPDVVPDWNAARATRYMPLVDDKLRTKELILPISIPLPSGQITDHYVLHYYFEICRGGDRQYSQLYSEDVVTGKTSGADESAQAFAEPQMAAEIVRDLK